MRTTWSFAAANELVFGSSSIEHIALHLSRRGFQRPLVISDRAIESAGIIEKLISPLKQAATPTEVFLDGEPEPSLKTAQSAYALAQDYQPDCLIGLGGGSNIDLSKMTAILYSHGGQPSDYFGFNKVPGKVIPIIGVPTTSGTGSEVSHAAVLTDSANKIKVSSLSSHLRPELAIVDPLLSITCPKQVTADSGIDALTHAIEAFCAVPFSELKIQDDQPAAYSGKNPMCDAMALEAVKLIYRHLPTAVEEPNNQKAREGMSLAATLAGLAFSHAGVAVVHALEYPMGGELHCSHGAGNGLLLPFVMEHNRSHCHHEYSQLAEAMGVNHPAMSENEKASAAIQAVHDLKATIGIPLTIRDLGGSKDQLATFAQKSHAITRLRQLTRGNPTEADLLKILKAAF